MWLDKRMSYFTVTQFAGLIRCPACAIVACCCSTVLLSFNHLHQAWLSAGHLKSSSWRELMVPRVQQLAVPCDLKLTMFVGGGVEDGAQAPHLSFVPIPLLSKVRCCRVLARSHRCSNCTVTQDPAVQADSYLPVSLSPSLSLTVPYDCIATPSQRAPADGQTRVGPAAWTCAATLTVAVPQITTTRLLKAVCSVCGCTTSLSGHDKRSALSRRSYSRRRGLDISASPLPVASCIGKTLAVCARRCKNSSET